MGVTWWDLNFGSGPIYVGVLVVCPGPSPIMQGLFVPFACVGSGDPV